MDDTDVLRVLSQPQVHVLADGEEIVQRRRLALVPAAFGDAVLELGDAVGTLGQVVHSVGGRVARVQEAAHVIDVILDGRLHALSWEGHDGQA